MLVATLLSQPVSPVPAVLTSLPKRKLELFNFCFSYRYRCLKLIVSGAKKPPRTPLPDGEKSLAEENMEGTVDLGWLPAFPHALLASMSNFLFGYHIGVMNGPIVSVARELGFEGDPILEGFVVSIFIAGAFIGSISCGSLVDKLGCRRTFQVDTIPLILGAIISAQAHSLNEILLGRFLVGLGIGVNTVLVPIYISEVAPTIYRGSLGALCQIGTCLGIIASLFLGIPSETDPHWWRMILYIASIPAFALSLGMQFAVDSPRWLCKVGRLDDAKDVINKIWGTSEVERAIENFQSVINNDGSDADSRWLELLEEPHSRGCIKAVSMLLAACAISFPVDEELSHNLSVIGILMYIFNFAIGAGPVTGLIIPELSSTKMRGKIMGFSFSVHWVCNFLVGLFFLDLIEIFGVAPVYTGFGSVSLLAALFAYYFIDETKGRSLEEIEMSLNPNFSGKDKQQ